MINNPIDQKYSALNSELLAIQYRIDSHQAALQWFDSCDFGDSKMQVARINQRMEEATKEIDRLDQKIRTDELTCLSLSPQASLGFNPRHWFSSERAKAKMQLSELRGNLKQFVDQKAQIQKTKDALRVRSERLQEELARYRCFDKLSVQAEVRFLSMEIEKLRPQITKLLAKKENLDKLISAPMNRLSDLGILRNKIDADIKRATVFETELGKAENSYERKKIHDRCSLYFSTGNPRSIINDLRRQDRSAEADIKKLTSRVNEIIAASNREIDSIIIDGNNLCYEQDRFIGLSALDALIPVISENCAISIIFDHGIRGQMRMNDRDLRLRFPHAKVHVVAENRRADETILMGAEIDSKIFVLSNDRFADFPEKNAVLGKRIIRHEIVYSTIYIHDMNIAIPLSNSYQM